MPEASVPTGLLERSYGVAGKVISGVGPDQWHLPTPCTEYDVTQLTEHLVGAAARPAVIGRGEELDGEVPVTGSAPPEGFPAAFEAARAATMAVWADPALLSRTFTLPWGEYPGASIALMYAMEMATHAWDLAVATGQDDLLDDDLAAALLPAAHDMVPADFRGGEMPFEAVVELDDGARPSDALAAYLGRSRP